MVKIRREEKISEGIVGAGVCFIIALICAIIAITAYQTNPKLTFVTGTFAVAAIIMLSVFLLVGDYHCYYCGKKILYRQKKIEVSWPEPAKYSDDEIVNITKVFHARCHQAAKVKGIVFKIPNPRFSFLEI